MSSRHHPLFGRPALALDARVVEARADEFTFVVRTDALDETGRRWLQAHSSLPVGDGSASSCRVRVTSAQLAANEAEPEFVGLLRGAQRAWCAPVGVPSIMAILNATPDSFSDGGQHRDPAAAIEAGLKFLEQGADWLDVGGESTRPGAPPVTIQEECARVLPVIRGLAAAGAQRISIDTRHGEVAEAALDAGASLVNDVGAGLDDPRMLEVVASAGCGYALMHRQGSIARMQSAPIYEDVLAEVSGFLRERVAACLAAGIDESRLWIDPGIGFGKRLEDNLSLLKRVGELRSLGIPLLVGASRKSFIGNITGAQKEADWARLEARDNPLERLGGTAAAITFCVAGGVKVLRVHDVAVMSEACAVAAAIQASPAAPDPLPC